MKATTLLLAIAIAMGTFLALLPGASATEATFGGSVQIDEHLAIGHSHDNVRSTGFDGLTTEAALKVAVDVSEHLSANVKLCYGCHGFETDMAYFDYRLGDELNVRFGRFSPSFGNFNLRHDPGNHRLSDKPLPYDMGRMLRLGAWNMGVLPSPFPDNGVEINGTHWSGEKVQLDYALYAVSGFKGDATATDLDFAASRSLYYVDNNGRPTVGGRLASTAKIGPKSDATLGVCGMYGTFDPDHRLSYAIFGADLTFRIARTNVRAEYLARRERFDVSDPSRFRFEVPATGGDFFTKHGAYVEIEQPIAPTVDLIGRVDGMYRAGNVLVGSPLSAHSSVVRYTLGAAIAVERNLRLKASTELWHFSDVDPNGRHLELSFHLAATATY